VYVAKDRSIFDHSTELEQKKGAEQTDGFSIMAAPRELSPSRLWPAAPKLH
jgi:hypothetical protein